MVEETHDILTFAERREVVALSTKISSILSEVLTPEEYSALLSDGRRLMRNNMPAHDDKGLSEMIMSMRTAVTFAEMVDADRNILLAILFSPFLKSGILNEDEISDRWGADIIALHKGLEEVAKFNNRNSATNQDNFRGLIISLARDIRVIIIMIVQSLVLMRAINLHPDESWVRNVAFEANCLYAQLAHRLGLYKIKGELEDLSLKYTNREIYTQIAHKLNATKRSRDAYIKAFIMPVKEALEKAGLKFEIKGRTKSISSIWNKMRKQKVDLPGIYDLFAIRVILDSKPEREKSDCWLAYSILTDMYTPNPARMRDWISIPKSNGYESLHATVMGPENKWVEVQFRTVRMDLVAEKGLAAHWRYKGGKADGTDQWMNNIRDILETAEAGPMQLMKNINMDPFGKEVFAFTPKGDLFRLSGGATVLDFAFHIHSNLGARCSGAIVNGRHVKLNYKIQNGDTVEILTSASQTPKQEWLNIVTSSKARNKIKQSLNEEKQRLAELGKESFLRRAKNRKIEIDESALMKMIKKLGYKFALDFYSDLGSDKIDVGRMLNTYLEATTHAVENGHVSAEEFEIKHDEDEKNESDVLVIGEKSINGLNYKFARCCNPIYGDDVFGFISSDGTVKIHKTTCPNAANIRSRYPYRVIRADWSGKSGSMLPATLKVVGNDDIGIVTNITSIISHEPGVALRNISIDSHDGLFHGYLVIGVSDNRQLTTLVKKIRTVKGVKDVNRV
ncbi:MAG: bifunctional (p)ppGpp synthetase/guanosine-3',5'-bis(diphosphate) 3'-pyrophosphohydrolase [Bacteroidales bacterium]|nr:bifunctional (p)ppGpp synthetase/guanosine-3',5'-bis(diphosphate) 3'-pyrophosphohydrolase [Bacteroidales bacterium]MBD5205940.1 bifunctional (p)ppGpp synthetase/guanosine-3',5'-bis(diphosphate) 3'-pyrophosphohydrolase [Bacteroidales bacterium]MBD5222686.1 bifunctional (p)ppGpp synthetase/guanosine-3',5'-bis(diphosphate) 3'-pyrophosphohydrolase [Bacteroidales bacterium]